MEKNDKETRDFMNVESFSQLPFIRPAPIKEKGIRLFGKEFGCVGGGDSAATARCNESESAERNNEEATKVNENGGDNSRRFECHYCCRNFPTSQALGGHQNAHKRERQNARRAHLQSSAATMHRSLSDAHIYGLVNYRLGSAPTPSMTYPPRNNSFSSSSNSRFYGNNNHSSFSQPPITGSPLGLWRIPTTVQSNSSNFNLHRSSSHPLPLFAGDELKPPSQVLGVGGGSSSQNRYVYESKPSVKDHVSLDLNL